MKSVKKIVIALLAFLALIPILFFGIGFFTPAPAAHLTRWAFGGTGEGAKDSYPKIDGFSDLSQNVTVLKNETYDSRSAFGKLDVYMPKNSGNEDHPTLFWVHGGAFVGGDKNAISNYMTMLAGQGYTVVSLNYDLAPESGYPAPIVQIGEAYRYVERNATQYGTDLTRVAFGGDSAGGQLVGQFVNVQVNRAYAERLRMTPAMEPDSIKAVVFFSALLDLTKFDNTDSIFSNYLFKKSAWAYFGEKDWKASSEVEQANIVGNIEGNYPPVYLTDGNTNSFQDQAEELSRQLAKQSVPVVTSFYEEKLGHEYQFDMSKQPSLDNYRKVTDFLASYLK